MTDGGKHGQIMAPWFVDENENWSDTTFNVRWSNERADVPELLNITTATQAESDYDSCGNTDKIVAAGDVSTYPAAWATRKYAPTTETAGKWCLPAAGVLHNIQTDWRVINTAAGKIGGANISNVRVWSSSEVSVHEAWNAAIKDSVLDYDRKDAYFTCVLPVLEF